MKKRIIASLLSLLFISIPILGISCHLKIIDGISIGITCLADGVDELESLRKENIELKQCLKKVPLYSIAECYLLINSTEEQREKWKERFKDEDKIKQYLLDYFFDHKKEIKKEEWVYTSFLLWYCHDVMPSKVKDYLKEHDEEIKRKILLNDEIKFKE